MAPGQQRHCYPCSHAPILPDLSTQDSLSKDPSFSHACACCDLCPQGWKHGPAKD